MHDEFDGGRLGDFVFFCDICGNKCWASETVLLTTYTGRGGLRTCKSCADPVDFGLVAYKIPPERPVPFAKDTTQSDNPGAIYEQYPPFDYEKFDWTTRPQQLLPIYWGTSEGRQFGNAQGYRWGLGNN